MAQAQKIFKALSDPTRLRIIQLLISGEKCVCEIHPCIKRTQSTTSLQLKKLEGFGLIISKRVGKYIYYRIKDQKLLKILDSAGLKGDVSCKKRKKTC